MSNLCQSLLLWRTPEEKTMSDKNSFNHEKIETHSFLMVVLIILVIAIGGMVEIVPLFFQKSTTQPLEGVVPLNDCS